MKKLFVSKRKMKTDEEYFNTDNFVQRDGKMQELLVTITLNEYRNLAKSEATSIRLSSENWTLKKEKEELEAQLAELKQKLANMEE